MALWQGKSRRKITGGRRRFNRGKRKTEIGAEQQICIVGDQTHKNVRTRGGHQKTKILSAQLANVYDPKKKITIRSQIRTVLQNPANPHYVRRNIITKGAIIETDKGKARVTSSPGKDGVINAILI